MSNDNTNTQSQTDLAVATLQVGAVPKQKRPVGRPRTNTTRSVTFARQESGNWKVAGRGRPKAGQERVGIVVAWDASFCRDSEYKLEGKAQTPVVVDKAVSAVTA